jgi:hypothetical protein
VEEALHHVHEHQHENGHRGEDCEANHDLKEG